MGYFVPGIPIGKTIIKDSKNFVKLFSQSSQLSFVTVQLLINSEKKILMANSFRKFKNYIKLLSIDIIVFFINK